MTEICKHQRRQQIALLCPDKPVMMSEERRICKSGRVIGKKAERLMRLGRKLAP
jgi:hypothetical protein